MSRKLLLILAGPTAVGKTELAIRLANRLNTVILSADSRQFFKELSIGTAKPSKVELAQAPHYFIDTLSIRESYSAGEYARDALGLLNTLFLEKDVVIMTGGSGLYISALTHGLADVPAAVPSLRKLLMQRLETEGLRALQEEIRHADPAFANTPEFVNPQRVVRALEVFLTSGRPISSFQVEKPSLGFEILPIAVERPRKELYGRINTRVDQMMTLGLVKEAESVREFRSHHALKTVGYKETFEYLDDLLGLDETTELIKKNTRHYAKRQLTGFRNRGDYEWFDASDEEGIATRTLGKLGM